ncbi:4308_t:CDS:2 [Dentiscutata erythropus]|uniref:4308_t:CDS:1 n=1 Tax=Dentiscutata erythropus TaxID=1348616 RepID=A0A9N9E6I5_9GLOM|nr:4308_t:CDS:2 [Dentiscutata erythropus]
MKGTQNIFDVFIEKNSIDFDCVTKELVMNDNGKKVNNAEIERVDEIVNCCQNGAIDVLLDIVLEREEIVKYLLEVLSDDDSDEFNCSLNYGNKEDDSVIKIKNKIKVAKVEFASHERTIVDIDRTNIAKNSNLHE